MTSPIDRMMDGVQWEILPPQTEPSDLPYATHKGTLRIGDFAFDAYRLSNGLRVLDADSVERFFFAIAEPSGGTEERVDGEDATVANELTQVANLMRRKPGEP